jgi:hypothetical protein
MPRRWRTADGQILTARQMSDTHLGNTINYLRARANKLYTSNYREFKDAGLEIRDLLPPIYDELVTELIRRTKGDGPTDEVISSLRENRVLDI